MKIKILEKLNKLLKSNPLGTHEGYRDITIGAIERKLNRYGIKNTTDYHVEHGKYLRVSHNSAGVHKVCDIFLKEDKTVEVKPDTISSYPSNFKYGECFPEAVVDAVVNYILMVQGKGDQIKGVK